MFAEWKDPKKLPPPVGQPLHVTIHRDWQKHNETLATVCYYLKDPRDGQYHYFEAGDLQNGLIGPESVQVVAWDYWPEPLFPGDAYTP